MNLWYDHEMTKRKTLIFLLILGIVVSCFLAAGGADLLSRSAEAEELEIVHLRTSTGYDFEVGKSGPGIETEVSSIYEGARFSDGGFVVEFPGWEFLCRSAPWTSSDGGGESVICSPCRPAWEESSGPGRETAGST